jgi:hypothetical protein
MATGGEVLLSWGILGALFLLGNELGTSVVYLRRIHPPSLFWSVVQSYCIPYIPEHVAGF